MSRKSLGRGLDALIGEGEAIAPAPRPGSPGVETAPVSRIAPCPFQPRQRFDPERLEELRRAIESQGVIEPLIVRRAPGGEDGRYELIAGERRLRAARAAGLETVPIIVRDLDDRAALEMSLVENLAREELNAVEEGRAFARLSREFGLSHDQIAGRIGKSRPHVSNAIRLLDLPEPVLEMIAQGRLSAGQARPILALPTPESRISAARRIVDGGLTARGAEELASSHRKRNGGAAPVAERASDPNLNALVENLQRALKRKVRVIRRRGKAPGRVEIDYYDENDLTALAAIMVAASTHTQTPQ